MLTEYNMWHIEWTNPKCSFNSTFTEIKNLQIVNRNLLRSNKKLLLFRTIVTLDTNDFGNFTAHCSITVLAWLGCEIALPSWLSISFAALASHLAPFQSGLLWLVALMVISGVLCHISPEIFSKAHRIAKSIPHGFHSSIESSLRNFWRLFCIGIDVQFGWLSS